MSIFRRNNAARQAETERQMREQALMMMAQSATLMLPTLTPGFDIGSGSSQSVIHERNHEGKPSATYVRGKPGSVLPKELLVHLQEVKGEDREKEVLKAVKTIGEKRSDSGFMSQAQMIAHLMAGTPT